MPQQACSAAHAWYAHENTVLTPWEQYKHMFSQ